VTSYVKGQMEPNLPNFDLLGGLELRRYEQ